MKVSEIILGKGRDRKRRGPRPGWEKRIGLHNRLKDTANDDSQVKSVISEGGSLPGVGAIHISEIEPTLTALEKVLGVDLKNNALGSVGKKEFSGDIDIALKIDAEQIPEFMDKLSKVPEISDIKKTSVIMSKVKIVGYDPRKQVKGKERTGYVQIDFMLGDPDWMKVYYHAPHEKNSKYKGALRTRMLATIAAIYNQDNSESTIDDGRPLESRRFMFSPQDGLVRILRTPMPNKKGDGYTKQNKNEIIDGPWKTADKIADILNLGTGDDLDSFETLYNAVKKNYDNETATRIFTDFANSDIARQLGVPEEVKGYANV